MSASVWSTSRNATDPWQLRRVLQHACDPAPAPSRAADPDARGTDPAPATDRLIALRARPDPESPAVLSAVASEQAKLARKGPARPPGGPPSRAPHRDHGAFLTAERPDGAASQPPSVPPADPAVVADIDSAWRALGRIRDELRAQAATDLVLRISRAPRRVARLLA